ncbi:hypothetical protein BV25DRAFT_1820190 [Artomyces pyxidatus]|uniref:Uncharacterized protein n=1 Tax=Artomyces pyxidatus TaxID=48021 RepID=A0ACB8TF42_9AGAM|nr:hypothetical protein BV25DRAFT_1820190 [Artomyces pyxidatus]
MKTLSRRLIASLPLTSRRVAHLFLYPPCSQTESPNDSTKFGHKNKFLQDEYTRFQMVTAQQVEIRSGSKSEKARL